MSNTKNISKTVRLIQFVILLVGGWFFFWEHIYTMIVQNISFIETVNFVTLNMAFYLFSIAGIIACELYLHRVRQFSVVRSSKVPEHLYTKNELTKKDSMKTMNKPSNRIGIAFLVTGVILLVFSLVTSTTVASLVGLGLTFWGGLFLFIRPIKFVKSSLLPDTSVSFYNTLDRIVDDLNYKGKPLCIPPFPKTEYLPEHLAGIKEFILFISESESATMPALEEMAKQQFMVKNPKGICIIPPGSGLLELFEKELNSDFSKMSKDACYDGLPLVIVNKLELANGFEIEDEKELIHVKIVNSVYNDLYTTKHELKTLQSVGSPLASAVACALAKNTGKVVSISKRDFSPNLNRIDLWYQIMES